jgi:hypothetical protein
VPDEGDDVGAMAIINTERRREKSSTTLNVVGQVSGGKLENRPDSGTYRLLTKRNASKKRIDLDYYCFQSV